MQPGYHKIQPGQKCRILTIQIAVPANTHSSDIADEMTGLLTTAIADEQSSVLDWRYVPGCGPDDANFAAASNEPVECEIFGNASSDGPYQPLMDYVGRMRLTLK